MAGAVNETSGAVKFSRCLSIAGDDHCWSDEDYAIILEKVRWYEHLLELSVQQLVRSRLSQSHRSNSFAFPVGKSDDRNEKMKGNEMTSCDDRFRFIENEILLRAEIVKLKEENTKLLRKLVPCDRERALLETKLAVLTRKFNETKSQCKKSTIGMLFKRDAKEKPIPKHLQRMKEIFEQLQAKITSAEEIAAILYQSAVLTLDEHELVINCSKTLTNRAARVLVGIILQKDSRQEYDCFLDALKETNQTDAYVLLTFPDVSIDSKHVEIIRRHYLYLLENVDAKFSGLSGVLHAKGVITPREYEDLERENNSIRATERLLSVLSRKSHEQFELFLKALATTGQQHIVNELCNQIIADHVVNADHVMNDAPHPAVPDSDEQVTEVTVDSSAETDRPRSEHVTVDFIQSLPGDQPIYGMTTLEKELYVCYLHIDKLYDIAVYDTETYSLQRRLSVPGLSGVRDMTSCKRHRCVYIADWNSVIHRHEKAGNRNSLWRVRHNPESLTVNSDSNLIVTYGKMKKLEIYTTLGQLIKEVKLQPELVHPYRAIQLSSEDAYVVCHGDANDSLHRVCLVDARGRVQRSFGDTPGSTDNQLCAPNGLASVNGHVIVADSQNKRLVMLNSTTLAFERHALADLSGEPWRMWFDEECGRLYVAIHKWDWPVSGHVEVYSIDS